MRRNRLPKHSLLLFIGILVASLGLFGYITYLSLVKPVNKVSQEEVTFTVNKGESTLAIARRLQEQGLIRSVFGFRLEVKRSGLAGKLQAGDYELSPSMSALEVANRLTKGFNTELRVTIPEGYRVEEVAARVEEVMGIPQKDFLGAAKEHEGYLFPETYHFSKDATVEQVVERMRTEFTNKTKGLNPTKEQVILASLIERETKTKEEKPIVSGILTKRLAEGWPLQLDATIQYIVGHKGEWWPNTTLLDRQRPSLYNTYLHQGVTPGPICNPGLESIKAAINPLASGYWYYLHGRDGVIRYAETSQEHESNIEKYIR